MGNCARPMMSAGSSMRGERFFMQSRTFSSVFIFMYLHSLQRHGSVGARITSKVGAQTNSLPGHSFWSRWMMPDSVTTMNWFAAAVGDHLLGRAYRIGQLAHLAQALGMHDNLRLRVRPFYAQQALAPELH